MFPDAAIAYILERHSSNDWMEHAIAAHSHKAHDDFYDMVGEGLYDLHNTYYPNCDDALEFYIEEGERGGMETVWAYGQGHSYLINVLGPTEADVVAFIESRPEYVFFFGPQDLDQGLQVAYGVSLIATYRIAVPAVTAEGQLRSGANPASMAVGEQSGTGVGTAAEEKFVVDGVRQWRPLEVLESS